MKLSPDYLSLLENLIQGSGQLGQAKRNLNSGLYVSAEINAARLDIQGQVRAVQSYWATHLERLQTEAVYLRKAFEILLQLLCHSDREHECKKAVEMILEYQAQGRTLLSSVEEAKKVDGNLEKFGVTAIMGQAVEGSPLPSTGDEQGAGWGPLVSAQLRALSDLAGRLRVRFRQLRPGPGPLRHLYANGEARLSILRSGHPLGTSPPLCLSSILSL